MVPVGLVPQSRQSPVRLRLAAFRIGREFAQESKQSGNSHAGRSGRCLGFTAERGTGPGTVWSMR